MQTSEIVITIYLLQGLTPYSLIVIQKSNWINPKVMEKIHEMSGTPRRNVCHKVTRDKVNKLNLVINCMLNYMINFRDFDTGA